MKNIILFLCVCFGLLFGEANCMIGDIVTTPNSTITPVSTPVISLVPVLASNINNAENGGIEMVEAVDLNAAENGGIAPVVQEHKGFFKRHKGKILCCAVITLNVLVIGGLMAAAIVYAYNNPCIPEECEIDGCCSASKEAFRHYPIARYVLKLILGAKK
ncbi:hypothetical protein FACS1894122_06330 [Alphaproteobacteria bacterium]|nr:hypothetical protein FACS1894122_06330 [Alphaproteobacteria bacterium]